MKAKDIIDILLGQVLIALAIIAVEVFIAPTHGYYGPVVIVCLMLFGLRAMLEMG